MYVTQGKSAERFSLRSGNSYYMPHVEVTKDTILLTLFPNTTLLDIRQVWKTVKGLQKKLPGYNGARKRRMLDRDLALIKLKKSLSPKASYNKLDEEVPDDDSDVSTALKGANRTAKVISDISK